MSKEINSKKTRVSYYVTNRIYNLSHVELTSGLYFSFSLDEFSIDI